MRGGQRSVILTVKGSQYFAIEQYLDDTSVSLTTLNDFGEIVLIFRICRLPSIKTSASLAEIAV